MDNFWNFLLNHNEDQIGFTWLNMVNLVVPLQSLLNNIPCCVAINVQEQNTNDVGGLQILPHKTRTWICFVMRGNILWEVKCIFLKIGNAPKWQYVIFFCGFLLYLFFVEKELYFVRLSIICSKKQVIQYHVQCMGSG